LAQALLAPAMLGFFLRVSQPAVPVPTLDDEQLEKYTSKESEEDYQIQLHEYMGLIAQIEQEFGSVSREMAAVLRRLCGMLNHHGRREKTLSLWNHLLEIEEELHLRVVAAIPDENTAAQMKALDKEYVSRRATIQREIHEVLMSSGSSEAAAADYSPRPEPRTCSRADTGGQPGMQTAWQENSVSAALLPSDSNVAGRNAELPAETGQATMETCSEQCVRVDDSAFFLEMRSGSCSASPAVAAKSASPLDAEDAWDAERPLQSFLKRNASAVRVVTSTTSLVGSVLLAGAAGTARYGYHTTADTSYTVAALALEHAVPESLVKCVARQSLAGLYTASYTSVDYGLHIGTSLLQSLPLEPIVHGSVNASAKIGDFVYSQLPAANTVGRSLTLGDAVDKSAQREHASWEEVIDR